MTTVRTVGELETISGALHDRELPERLEATLD
jgi:hypothetical protein